MAASLVAGDRVLLLVPGSDRYLDVVLSLLVRGIVPIPADPALTAPERDWLRDYVSPTVTVTDPAELAGLAFGWEPGDVPRARPMHLTSGTTGSPKGVWSGVLTAAEGAALLADEQQAFGFSAADLNLVLGPLYHSAPLRFAMWTLLSGGRNTGFGADGRQDRFDPARLTAAIATERPTIAFGAPAHLQRLFRHWDATDWPDLSSFRLIAHAGAPCPEPVKLRAVERFPAGSVWEFYGSTEGQFTLCSSEEWRARPRSVGRARPGRRLRIGDDGRIWCATPRFARFEYFGDPERTAAAWNGEEFTVGDLGRLDEDGYLYLDGRRDDLIITGGVNVYPAEVERTLERFPGVVEVAVYGVPDAEWGHRVSAAVVGDVDEAGLRAWAAAHLAPSKRPKDYRFLTALPRTRSGKVRRLDLADQDGAPAP